MLHSTNDNTQVALQSTRWLSLLGLLVRAALPLGFLAVGVYAYSVFSVGIDEAKDPPTEEQVIRTQVTTLHVQDYPVTIKAHGVVQPHNQVTLSAQVPGKITKIHPMFEVGSYFAEGEVLVELDSRDYQTAVALAEAQQNVAKSALELAQLNYERKQRLFRENVVAVAEVNQASATRAQASAELDSAATQVEQAERDLERTKIRAPFDGRVRLKSVGLGESVGLGTPLGEIFAVDFAEVRLPIAGRELQLIDLPELADDAPLAVELRDAINASSARVWQARIVRTEGTLDADSLELFAIARVDDPFGRKSGHPPLRIGQPVVGSITGTVLTNVVAVPRMAVRQLDQVILVDEQQLTLMSKTIEPVWSNEDHVIVRDPTIADGALLSTTHLVYAPNGAKVEIIGDIASGESESVDGNKAAETAQAQSSAN